MYGHLREVGPPDVSSLARHYERIEEEHRRRKISKAAPVRPALSREFGDRNFRAACDALIDRIVGIKERYYNKHGKQPTALYMGVEEWQTFAASFCYKKYSRAPGTNLQYMGMYVHLVSSCRKLLGAGV